MSLLGAAVTIIAGAIDDSIKNKKINKKIKSLEQSKINLTKEYEKKLNNDFRNNKEFKKSINTLNRKKEDKIISRKSPFNPSAYSSTEQINEATKESIKYNNAIKQFIDKELKNKEKNKDIYKQKIKNIDNKIFNAEINKA